ncbi:hypothetical protein [Sandarakinorhabdus limnophila]|uniref:hypothetical protein n=1 Tax=Sandarakinorhabdus limnophila TaxID=210512 RepID=UPI0026F2F4EE|nr:hypothetical protein [Sandarakinorhabdus limnophila]MCM0033457.1 hypothetical protein [Sandarakinorhabdus limnophila]
MNCNPTYVALLNEVCVGLGFCGSVADGEPLHVDQFIPESGALSADQFVNWVFRAEGMEPEGDDAQKHTQSVREAFVRHMGANVVDAASLK